MSKCRGLRENEADDVCCFTWREGTIAGPQIFVGLHVLSTLAGLSQEFFMDHPSVNSATPIYGNWFPAYRCCVTLGLNGNKKSTIKAKKSGFGRRRARLLVVELARGRRHPARPDLRVCRGCLLRQLPVRSWICAPDDSSVRHFSGHVDSVQRCRQLYEAARSPAESHDHETEAASNQTGKKQRLISIS